MSHIKLSIPNDDEVALHYFGEAMIKLAAAIRGEDSVDVRVEPITMKIDEQALERLQQATRDLMQAAPAMLRNNDVDGSIEVHGKLKVVEPDTTSQQVESLAIPVEANGATYETDLGSDNPQAVPVTDSTGTPWDERIHSASKALNSDGTWRVRRKPADKTPEEWAEYIKWVEEDIHTIQHGESIDDWADEQIAKLENPEPPITTEGDDFHTDAGVVTEQQVASFPPPPPVPVPPAPEFDAQEQLDWMAKTPALTETERHELKVKVNNTAMTFPQVMAFLTERHGRITSAQVDRIIADMGLEKITDLNTQPEHTGPFIARVKAHLGE
jgi:hypothetical protein